MERYDLVVIGGGPGGYNAVLEGMELGANVALIEKHGVGGIGGTCRFRGCIPTKAWYESVRDGLSTEEATERRKYAVSHPGGRRPSGSHRMKLLKGTAFLESPDRIRITGDGKREIIEAGSVIVATGSRPIIPPEYAGVGHIVTSDDIFGLEKMPGRILIVGCGYIGCEFAHIFGSYGSDVTMVEALPRVLSAEDDAAAAEVAKAFAERDIEVKAGTRFEPSMAGDYDLVLLAIGRIPNSYELGLEELGVKLGDNGGIEVDSTMMTNVNSIRAAGDVVNKPFRLAHVAEAEGSIAARNALGYSGVRRTVMKYDTIPSTIFTDPMIASVGKREFELMRDGVDYVAGKSAHENNPMARCCCDTRGFVKIMVEKPSGRILGASAVGRDADVHPIVTAMGFEARGRIEDLADTVFFHPGWGESIKMAAEDALRKL